MIKIADKVAKPTQYPMHAGLSIGRKGTIAAYENARDNWYAWTSFDAYKGWAEEVLGAEEPTVTAIAKGDLDAARIEKRCYEAALNSQQLLGQIGAASPLDNAPLTHLPNFSLHPDAPKRTFYAKDRRTGHLGLHQMNSGASEPDNAARKQRTQVTIYTNPDTKKIHTHTNVGKDVIHATTDTSANRKVTGPPPAKLTQKEKMDRGYRNYGGYSNDDFASPDGTKRTMRGHANGYADTIPKPDVEEVLLTGATRPYRGNTGFRLKPDKKPGAKKGALVRGTPYQSKTSNNNPLCYYAESDGNGGEDLGEKVKNHEQEGLTRQHGGTYAQANKFSSTSTLLGGGMHIPDTVHYLRDVPSDTQPYASFTSGEDLSGKASTLWGSHVQPTATFPTPMQWDPATQSLDEMFPDEPSYQPAPPTPFFLPDAYERVEEDVPTGMELHTHIPGTDGADSVAFSETKPGTYEIGRFHPQFQQPL